MTAGQSSESGDVAVLRVNGVDVKDGMEQLSDNFSKYSTDVLRWLLMTADSIHNSLQYSKQVTSSLTAVFDLSVCNNPTSPDNPGV